MEMDYNNNSGNYRKKLMLDRAGRAVVYANGSCKNPGMPDALGGVGVWFGYRHVFQIVKYECFDHLRPKTPNVHINSPINMSECVRGRQTCNTAQIQAVTNAIRQAKRNGLNRVNVYTNSELVAKAFQEYFNIWKKNGWVNKRGNRVQNFLDWIYLLKAMKGMQVVCTFVGNNQRNMGRDASKRLAHQYVDSAEV